jgi:hypothetical protein
LREVTIMSKRRGGWSLIKLLTNRRGTAEIVGSVLFLVILLFFFTNVYLWHDQVTRQMDNVLTDRVSSGVDIAFVDGTNAVLQVTNEGGIGFSLSRLWITTSNDHNYADFEKDQTIWVAGGSSLNINLTPPTTKDTDGSYLVDGLTVYYALPSEEVTVTFKILTTLGNTAAVTRAGVP